MEQSFFEILKIGMGDYSLHHLVWHMLIVTMCIFTTGIFSIADTISGVYTAKKTGEKLRSATVAGEYRLLTHCSFSLYPLATNFSAISTHASKISECSV